MKLIVGKLQLMVFLILIAMAMFLAAWPIAAAVIESAGRYARQHGWR